MIHIYISNFRNSGNLKDAVSIAASSPQWFRGRIFKELAPSWKLINSYKKGLINKSYYEREYLRQLNSLNVHQIAFNLSGKVLLCWEPKGQFCHRYIVARWFEDNGYRVKEI